MIEWLENIDRAIFLFFNQLHNPFMDEVMWVITSKGFGIPFYALMLFLIVKKLEIRKAIFSIVLLAVTVGVADLTARYGFKEVFMRYRPSQNLDLYDQVHLVNDYRGGMYGFVSNHAANMFSLALAFYLLMKEELHRKALFFFPVAAIIAYSRVYLGVHYPSDIFVGALVGMSVAFLLNLIFNKFVENRL